MTGLRMRWSFAAALMLAAVVCASSLVASAVSCSKVKPHQPTPAELAFLAADYEKSAGLYRADLSAHPNDAELTAGLVRVLLRQQKITQAADTVKAALDKVPTSAVLLTAKSEVEYRAGTPWDAAQSLGAALAADPCLPRAHLEMAKIARLDSLYATAKSQAQVAWQLDPNDPEIRNEHVNTLPLRERIAELEKYLASPTGDDAERRHSTQLYLDHLKKMLDEPHKPCTLVSQVESTEIPFAAILNDASHIRAFGLDIKFNHKNARLEIDTGASGLTVTQSIAKRAGLTEFFKTQVGGVGDQGMRSSYLAYADSIQVGNLEFHDCAVHVVDDKNMMQIDGLVGMDVFSKFLVSLDYIDRKLTLGPLPPRPGEAVAAPTLKTESGESDDAESDKPAQPAQSAESAKPVPPPPPARGPQDRYIAPEMKDYTRVYRVGHNLMLPVSLNRSKLKLFILDTGFWATTISPAAAREVTKVGRDSNLHIKGLSGEVDKVYTADAVTFAFAHVEQEIRDVPSIDVTRISQNVGLDVSGFLGARTLQLVTTHIDYRDGLVKFDYDPKKAGGFNPL